MNSPARQQQCNYANLRRRPPPPGDPSLAGTIDLHGLRRQDAIGKLTRFLSDVTRWKAKRGRGGTTGAGVGPVWVCVVTGSGSHSATGPVIRTAVSSLLAKRGMTYVANRGGGSFTVDAASGIELSDDPRTRYVDTKVLLKHDHRSGSSPDLVNPAMRSGGVGMGMTGSGARSLPVSRRGSDSSTVMAVNGDRRSRLAHASSDRAINGDSHGYSAQTMAAAPSPIPAEVAANDALLRHARSAAAAAASRDKSRRQKEEREMVRVLSESKLLTVRDEEGRRELQRALARSVEDTGGRSEVDTAEDVERAIRESVALAEMEAAEREAMARVVAAGGGNGGQGGAAADVGFANDGDGAVQRAIQDSLDLVAKQRQQQERQQQAAARSFDPEEEIRRAIQESLASAPPPQHDGEEVCGYSYNEDEDDAVDRAIRESLASAASETFERMSSRGAEEDEVEQALRESLTLTSASAVTTTSGLRSANEDEDGRHRDRQKGAAAAAAANQAVEERGMMEEALRRSMAEEATVGIEDDGGDVVVFAPGGAASASVIAFAPATLR